MKIDKNKKLRFGIEIIKLDKGVPLYSKVNLYINELLPQKKVDLREAINTITMMVKERCSKKRDELKLRRR